jgi:imidazolonepropionase-like amidohydrolase
MVDNALLKMAVDKKIFVVPTAAVISNVAGANSTASLVGDPHFVSMLTKSDIEGLQKTFPNRTGNKTTWDKLKYNIKTMAEAGVPILAGTDAPNPGTIHGASLHHELELLVQAGLTTTQALAAATSQPAQHFKLDDRGRVAVGLRADLLLVSGNPLDDIRQTREIAGVWKAGRAIDRSRRMENVRQLSEGDGK